MNTLFVIGQAGQAAYLLPLWKRWVASDVSNNWSILAHEDAVKIIRSRAPDVLKHCIGGWADKVFLSNLILSHKLELIVTSASGKKREIEASQYAFDCNVPHLQFNDSWGSCVERVLRSNPVNIKPDKIAVVDSTIDAGIFRDRIEQIGHPVWEEYLMGASYCAAPRDRVVFASQPLSKVPAVSDIGYDEHQVWDYILNFCTRYPDVINELVFHPHPSQSYRPENMSDFVRLSEPHENVFETCGSMISMCSSIMVEGYMQGQSVVSLQPGLRGRNYCTLSDRGYIPLVNSYSDEMLLGALNGECRMDFQDISLMIAGSLDRLEALIGKLLVPI